MIVSPEPLPWRGRSRQLDLPVDQIVALYREGYTIPEIASVLAVGTATIPRRLVQANEPRRKQGTRAA